MVWEQASLQLLPRPPPAERKLNATSRVSPCPLPPARHLRQDQGGKSHESWPSSVTWSQCSAMGREEPDPGPGPCPQGLKPRATSQSATSHWSCWGTRMEPVSHSQAGRPPTVPPRGPTPAGRWARSLEERKGWLVRSPQRRSGGRAPCGGQSRCPLFRFAGLQPRLGSKPGDFVHGCLGFLLRCCSQTKLRVRREGRGVAARWPVLRRARAVMSPERHTRLMSHDARVCAR